MSNDREGTALSREERVTKLASALREIAGLRGWQLTDEEHRDLHHAAIFLHELQQDVRRLDWLDRNRQWATYGVSEPAGDPKWAVGHNYHDVSRERSLRDAIDHAMRPTHDMPAVPPPSHPG